MPDIYKSFRLAYTKYTKADCRAHQAWSEIISECKPKAKKEALYDPSYFIAIL